MAISHNFSPPAVQAAVTTVFRRELFVVLKGGEAVEAPGCDGGCDCGVDFGGTFNLASNSPARSTNAVARAACARMMATRSPLESARRASRSVDTVSRVDRDVAKHDRQPRTQRKASRGVSSYGKSRLLQ